MLSNTEKPKKDSSGASFNDLLFSTLFGAIFALKLQNLYTIQCPVGQTYDIPKGLDIFLIYAVYSLFFIYSYWRWVHPFNDLNKRTIIRIVSAAIAPFLGWDLAIYFGWWWRSIVLPLVQLQVRPEDFQRCFPNSSIFNFLPLNTYESAALYIIFAFIQGAIVILPGTSHWKRWQKGGKK